MVERRFMSAISMRRIFLVLLCVAAGGAWAQTSPVVMPFPLGIKRVPGGFGKEDKEASDETGAEAAVAERGRAAGLHEVRFGIEGAESDGL